MILAAEREGEKIAVEVKSFLGKSIISDFHEAIGQYLDYQSALEDFEPQRIVYLAIPSRVFEQDVFQGRFIQKRLKEECVNLIVFDPSLNEIMQWIKYRNTTKS